MGEIRCANEGKQEMDDLDPSFKRETANEADSVRDLHLPKRGCLERSII